MCIMTNGQKKAQCKYCFHFLSEGSNTTLKNHITHPHCEVLKAQQNQNPEARQTSSRDPYARLLHGLKGHTKKKARNDPTMSSEYEQYLKADFVSHLHPKDFATFDVLGFWKAKENQFPVLSRMAMDILSDHLDAQERKQDTSPLELPLDVEEGVFNVEVQQNEATQLTDQEIALDASSDGSSGEPRHDYMMSSGAEDDQTEDGHDGSMSH
ncbi:zinc finger BED domain-containing protein RICESLEEPER 2, partial [Tanacetum coccineum]